MQGQLSIWDLLEDKLADRYDDGIPNTIQEVVEIIEQRTGLNFKEKKPYKSIVGVYQSKYKGITFQTSLGRYAEGVFDERRYISCYMDGGLWGESRSADSIDEAIDRFKNWIEKLEEEQE